MTVAALGGQFGVAEAFDLDVLCHVQGSLSFEGCSRTPV